MKKIKYFVALMILYSVTFSQQTGNSNWQHVGPKSSVDASGNITGGFETSQMSVITIDPNPLKNGQHLFAGSNFGGLWESTDGGASWVNINTNSTGLNGISSIAFINTTQIMVGNYHPNFSAGKGGFDYSTRVSVYTFEPITSWNNLGTLPTGTQPFVIRSVAIHPGNSQVLFVCTSVGLFRSANGGTSWGTGPVV